MAYGAVKVDSIVYDNSGSDVTVAVSDITTASELNAKADLASPALTGNPTAPTQPANDNSTKISTTAYVQIELGDYATLANPALTGSPTAPTQAADDNSTKIETTQYVQTELGDYATTSTVNTKAPINSPAFTADIELSAQAPLKFMDADSSNYVALRAPGSVTSNITWTLPAEDGSADMLLKTDGSGNLGWVAASSSGTSLGLAIALG